MTADEIARFHTGESRLFTELVRAHSPHLLGAALHLTRDRDSAHDLVHDTWVRAFEARRSFRGTGSLLGWLLAILRTCCRSSWRSEERHSARERVYVVS